MHSLRKATIFPNEHYKAVPEAALKFGMELHQKLSGSYDSHSNNPWHNLVYITATHGVSRISHEQLNAFYSNSI